MFLFLHNIRTHLHIYQLGAYHHYNHHRPSFLHPIIEGSICSSMFPRSFYMILIIFIFTSPILTGIITLFSIVKYIIYGKVIVLNVIFRINSVLSFMKILIMAYFPFYIIAPFIFCSKLIKIWCK